MHKVYAVHTLKQTLKRDKPAYICVQTLHVYIFVQCILSHYVSPTQPIFPTSEHSRNYH